MLALLQKHFDEIVAHAREANPRECCGLIGGTTSGETQTVYRMRNVAADPLAGYEAAPEDLFASQRIMRQRNERLLAIYHSHPRAADPQPSATDVRLAYYPSAVYFIVGLSAGDPRLRAFRISEREGRWEAADFQITK